MVYGPLSRRNRQDVATVSSLEARLRAHMEAVHKRDKVPVENCQACASLHELIRKAKIRDKK